MGFYLKKIVGDLLMPLPLVFLAAALGGVALWRGHRKVGRGLVVGAGLLLWGASCAPLVDPGVRALERRYPVFPGDSVAYVVVLASGHVSDPAVPPGARLSGSALQRLTEGLRIALAQPWATLVLSGYGGADPLSNAEMYRVVAEALGMDTARTVLEPRPVDTAGEARLLAPLLAGEPFALVTSASHMPRAVALFRGQGLEPVPAPTGHLVKDAPWRWGRLLPSAQALHRAERLWYEILGSVWIRLRGQAG